MITTDSVNKTRSIPFLWYKQQDFKLISNNLQNIRKIDERINKLLNRYGSLINQKTFEYQKTVQFAQTHKIFKKYILNKMDGIFLANCAGYLATFCLVFCFMPFAPFAIGSIGAMVLTGAICSLIMSKISFVNSKKAFVKLAEKISEIVPDFPKEENLNKLLASYSKLLEKKLSKPRTTRKTFKHSSEPNSRNDLLKKALTNLYKLRVEKNDPLLQRRDTSLCLEQMLKPDFLKNR